MTITAQTTNLHPLIFSPGQPILRDDLLPVVRQLNWSGANRPSIHAALNTGDAGDGDLEIPALRILFPTTPSVFTTRLRFRPFLSPDVVTTRCRFVVTVDVNDGSTVRTRLTVGSAAAVTTVHAFGTSTTQINTATSSSGTGLQTVTLELERVSPGTSPASLDAFTFMDSIITSIPSPVE